MSGHIDDIRNVRARMIELGSVPAVTVTGPWHVRRSAEMSDHIDDIRNVRARMIELDSVPATIGFFGEDARMRLGLRQLLYAHIIAAGMR